MASRPAEVWSPACYTRQGVLVGERVFQAADSFALAFPHKVRQADHFGRLRKIFD